MQLLTEQEIDLVSGGEVGATGMGDDVHYDGKMDGGGSGKSTSKPKDRIGDWIMCANGDGQACVNIFWNALGM